MLNQESNTNEVAQVLLVRLMQGVQDQRYSDIRKIFSCFKN